MKINGEVVNEVNLSQGSSARRTKTGGFAFQNHGRAVWVKKVRVKNLDEK